MTIAEQFEALRVSLDSLASQITTLIASKDAQILALQQQIVALLAQVASGMSAAEAATALAGLTAVETRLRALVP